MSKNIKYILLLLCGFAALRLPAQNIVMGSSNNENLCTGKFFDSGGLSGAGYSENENLSHTLCSMGGGQSIKINFTAFNVDPKDTLYIFDGATNTAPLLGKFTNDDLLGLTIGGSNANATGCLTFHFTSDNSNNGFWEGLISCGNKCIFPTAIITGGTDIVRLCPGESIALNASSSTAGAGSIAKYEWFSKKDTVVGTNYNSNFPNPNGLQVELRVTNSAGCSNIKKEEVLVLVSTPPVFTGTSGDTKACTGKSACLTGKVSGIAYKEEIPKYSGGTLALPDRPDNGVACFNSTLNFTIFTPGQKLKSASDLQSICVDIEHSYLDDLTIKITCPNGQSTKLFNRGGAGKHLGIPVLDDNPPVTGTCGHYCWTDNSLLGQLQNAGSINQTVPYGNYKSTEPFTNLIGCPLNGAWVFEVCDMQKNDNGSVCTWDLTFNPNSIPKGISFTPTFNLPANDSTAWVSDASIFSTSANGDTICAAAPAAGIKNFTYKATNNFGCTYDTVLSVKSYPFPKTNLNDSIQVCTSLLQSPIDVSMSASAEGSYHFSWQPTKGLSVATSAHTKLLLDSAQTQYILKVYDDAAPNCITFDTTQIKKIPVPTAALLLDTNAGCVPLTIKMKDNTNPKPIHFQWFFGDGTDSASAVDSTTHRYTNFGTDTLKYIISTFDGCTDTATHIINAAPAPLVIFLVSPPDAYRDFPYFCFQNASVMGGSQYTWRFGNEGASSQESDCFMFSDSVKCHPVQLRATNNFGCSDSLTKAVCVKNSRQKIFAPNAFTPNDDHHNETFIVVSEGVFNDGYQLSIFDKWGNNIWESNTPNSAWNGNGNNFPAPSDVYVYKLKYKDEWGTDQQIIGSVTLIR